MSEETNPTEAVNSENSELEKIKDSMAFIKSSKTEVESMKKELQKKASQLTQTAQTVETALENLQNQASSIEELFQEIAAIKLAVEGSQNAVNDNLKTVTEGKAAFDTLQQTINEQAKVLGEQQSITQAQIQQIAQEHKRVTEFIEQLFNDVTDAEGKVSALSLNSKLAHTVEKAVNAFSSMQDMLKNKEKEFNELKVVLEDKILELLPSAAAAGLAFTYDKARRHYTGFFKGAFLYTLFLAPLCLGAYFFIVESDSITIDNFLSHLLYASPLIAIATFGLWSIRLHRRLYEEYSHKQSVMELYDGFKKEIDEVGKPEQQQRLIDIMLETVAHKPSLAMSKYEQDSELDTLSVWQIIKLRWLPPQVRSLLNHVDDGAR